jgi:hypothetical protein
MSDSILGPYRSVGCIDLGYGTGTGVWAPFIIRDTTRILLFYAVALTDGSLSIRVAECIDRQLNSWNRGISGTEIVVASEEGARDPVVLRDTHTGLYFIYYVATVQERLGVVKVRTSRDLISWSEPQTVLGTPPKYGAPESVFVIQRGEYYYMWVSSAADYSVMSLYVSRNPFNFGDATANRIEEQHGHAAEIVHTPERDWIACVAIASVPGLEDEQLKVPTGEPILPIGQHDLEGVYLLPLEWHATTPELQARVTDRY